MALAAYTPTVYANGTAPAQNATNLNKTETAVKNVTDTAILLESKVTNLSAPVKTPYAPQTAAPVYAEGQVYYDANYDALVAQNGISDAPILLGFANHMHVINNTGAIIEKGMAVRHNGVDANGEVQITKAIATSFINARVLGVAQHSIGIGAVGHIITFGGIFGLNTSGVAAGVPLYLSDTTAGTWTATAPKIVTQIGGALTSAASGNLFVSIIQNSNLPNVYASLTGQTTALYSLTTTSKDIAAFTAKTEYVTLADLLTGVVTVPNDGAYRANFTASISFVSAVTTRSVVFEVYDVTGVAILYSFTKNITRDSTQDGISFSFPLQRLVGNQIKMRVKSSVGMDITFDSVVFDIESVTIR